MELNIYLNFDGVCEPAFNYYAKHIGGRITALMKFGDSPMAQQIPAESRDKIMHACIEIDGYKLMGTDCTPDHPYRPIHCACVALQVDDVHKAEKIFAALADGGDVNMPLQETFWAKRYGMTIDRFGVPWMVNCAKPM